MLHIFHFHVIFFKNQYNQNIFLFRRIFVTIELIWFAFTAQLSTLLQPELPLEGRSRLIVINDAFRLENKILNETHFFCMRFKLCILQQCNQGKYRS